MSVLRYDIDHRANVPLIYEIAVTQGGVALDFSGYDAFLQVRRYQGDPSTAQADLVLVTDDAEGVSFPTADGAVGVVRVRIDAATLLGFTGLSTTGNVVRYEYDLIVEDPSALRQVIVAGFIDLTAGVTA